MYNNYDFFKNLTFLYHHLKEKWRQLVVEKFAGFIGSRNFWNHIFHIFFILKSYFESELLFWIWNHILILKSYFDSEIIFWFWNNILILKSYFDSEIIFWFWNHILILILLGLLLIFWIVSGLKKRITCDIIKIFATSLCIMCMDSLISLVKTYFFFWF